MEVNGLIGLILTLVPLLILQRSLHRELQGILLALTRRVEIAIATLSILFLPGVVLHEASHFLMARLLRVRTGRISLIPRSMPGGKLQLGYVETARTDTLRDTLIGIAPLITGGIAIASIGLGPLNILPAVQLSLDGDLTSLGTALLGVPSQPDFWVWFYLLFAISTTMFPSSSDRRSWFPVGITVLFLIVAALVSGLGPWLAEHVAPGFNQALATVAAIFAISAGVHFSLLIPAWLIRLALFRAFRLRLVSTGRA